MLTVRFFAVGCLVVACGGSAQPPPSAAAAPLPTVAKNAPSPPPPRAPASARRGAALEVRYLDGGANTTGGRMALGPSGEVFVVGSFNGTLRFGDLPALTSSEEDAFVLALDPSGKPAWSRRIGGAAADYGDDVAVDATGVYVSGAFESKVVDPGSGPLRCAGIHDLFLVKYAFDGALLWAHRYGDALDQIDMRLRAHPQGGVIATGWYNGNVDFGSGAVHGALPPKASFVARIDASGRGLWARAFGHRYDYAETDAVVDAAGHVFVSGGSEGTSEFVRGGHPSATNDLGPVLLELDAGGKLLSAQRFGSGADNLSTALALAPDGSLRFVAGSRGAIDFGDGARRPVGYEEAIDVARFDGAALAWSARVLSDRLASVSAATVDRRGDTVVAAHILRHEATPKPYGHDAGRGVIVSLSPSGAMNWTYVLDEGLQSGFESVALDAHGRIVASGTRGNALVLVTLEP